MATKSKTKTDLLNVVEVATPASPLAAGVAFTLPPLTPEALPPGAVTLPAGTLREIRVDRDALYYNTIRPNDPKPTMRVIENGKSTSYYAVEIRGSSMLKNGTEQEKYGCGGVRNAATAMVVTLAELVCYKRKPQ